MTNNGPNPATGVTLTDPLPAFTNFKACRIAPDTVCPNPGVAVGANGTVTVNLPDMPALSNQIVRIDVTVDGDGILAYNDNNPPGITQISNTATVSTSSSDPNLSNNASLVTTSVNYCNPGVSYRPNKNWRAGTPPRGARPARRAGQGLAQGFGVGRAQTPRSVTIALM